MKTAQQNRFVKEATSPTDSFDRDSAKLDFIEALHELFLSGLVLTLDENDECPTCSEDILLNTITNGGIFRFVVRSPEEISALESLQKLPEHVETGVISEGEGLQLLVKSFRQFIELSKQIELAYPEIANGPEFGQEYRDHLQGFVDWLDDEDLEEKPIEFPRCSLDAKIYCALNWLVQIVEFGQTSPIENLDTLVNSTRQLESEQACLVHRRPVSDGNTEIGIVVEVMFLSNDEHTSLLKYSDTYDRWLNHQSTAIELARAAKCAVESSQHLTGDSWTAAYNAISELWITVFGNTAGELRKNEIALDKASRIQREANHVLSAIKKW